MPDDEGLGGLLGGGDEAGDIGKSEAAIGAEAISGADAFAAAITVNQAGYGPGVAAAAAAFLRRQGELLTKQGHILDAQLHDWRHDAPIRQSLLLGQAREARLRRTGLRVRVGLQVFTVLAITAVAFALLDMVYGAATSQSVVVTSFDTPPALAASGLSGKVLASGVLDTLRQLQAATRASTAALDSVGAWSSDIKVQVPEIGLSIGEIGRLLHERFGHDVHIEGALVQTGKDGLALTVRGDHVPARTFVGGAGDLDKLTVQAAEYVYGRSQPARYATYLGNAGRNADALAFLPGAFARAGSDEERATLVNVWGNAYAALNKPAQALEKFRLLMQLVPRHSSLWWTGWTNASFVLPLVAGEEAASREAKAFLNEADKAPEGEKPELRLMGNSAAFVWDLPLVLASTLDDAKHNGGAGASITIDGPTIADNYAMMHDFASASRYMAASDPADPTTVQEARMLQGYAALDRGDAAAAVPPLQDYYTAWLADPSQQTSYPDLPCFLGLALGRAGRMPEADAVFKRVGNWSRCHAFQGDVLAHEGDMDGARRVWAAGLQTAPDLPVIYLHRGLAELKNGDAKAAAADFATAHDKAPHWADPLKAWGDLLAMQKRWDEAGVKYGEALKYAPGWVELRKAVK